jgi:hypothetical protein
LLLAVLFTYGSGTVQNSFLVEFGIGLLFSEGKRRSEQDCFPVNH